MIAICIVGYLFVGWLVYLGIRWAELLNDEDSALNALPPLLAWPLLLPVFLLVLVAMGVKEITDRILGN